MRRSRGCGARRRRVPARVGSARALCMPVAQTIGAAVQGRLRTAAAHALRRAGCRLAPRDLERGSALEHCLERPNIHDPVPPGTARAARPRAAGSRRGAGGAGLGAIPSSPTTSAHIRIALGSGARAAAPLTARGSSRIDRAACEGCGVWVRLGRRGVLRTTSGQGWLSPACGGRNLLGIGGRRGWRGSGALHVAEIRQARDTAFNQLHHTQSPPYPAPPARRPPPPARQPRQPRPAIPGPCPGGPTRAAPPPPGTASAPSP